MWFVFSFCCFFAAKVWLQAVPDKKAKFTIGFVHAILRSIPDICIFATESSIIYMTCNVWMLVRHVAWR